MHHGHAGWAVQAVVVCWASTSGMQHTSCWSVLTGLMALNSRVGLGQRIVAVSIGVKLCLVKIRLPLFGMTQTTSDRLSPLSSLTAFPALHPSGPCIHFKLTPSCCCTRIARALPVKLSTTRAPRLSLSLNSLKKSSQDGPACHSPQEDPVQHHLEPQKGGQDPRWQACRAPHCQARRKSITTVDSAGCSL